MKATIYKPAVSDNLKVILENGEVWYYSIGCGCWKPSGYKWTDLQNSGEVTKMATVNNFKMKRGGWL